MRLWASSRTAERQPPRVIGSGLWSSPGSAKVVALGETGLDRYRDHTPWATQQELFDRHLRLSQDTGLPVIIHMRDCGAELLAMLRAARGAARWRA